MRTVRARPNSVDEWSVIRLGVLNLSQHVPNVQNAQPDTSSRDHSESEVASERANVSPVALVCSGPAIITGCFAPLFAVVPPQNLRHSVVVGVSGHTAPMASVRDRLALLRTRQIVLNLRGGLVR